MKIKQQTGIIINSFIPNAITAGDTVTFGRYENRPIKWQVLHVDEYNNRALIMSEKIITRRQYGSHIDPLRLSGVIIVLVFFLLLIAQQIPVKYILDFFTYVYRDIQENGLEILWGFLIHIFVIILFILRLYYSYINFVYDDISWSNSKIREWLNSKFINNAFNRNELQYIIDNNASPTIINVEITKAKLKQKISFQYKDKVFLLSRDELEYFSKIITLQESGESGASDNDDTTYWLSYPVYNKSPRVADKYGKISRRSWRRTSGVRPAIWMHI